jgi:hypothetical protein
VLQQLQLQDIPTEYRFDYMRSFQRLIEIRDSLQYFDPETKSDREILKKKLMDYHNCFKYISDINEIILKNI